VSCYKCGAAGHKENMCPLRKSIGKWAPPKENETTEKEIIGKPCHLNEENFLCIKQENQSRQGLTFNKLKCKPCNRGDMNTRPPIISNIKFIL